MTTTAEKTALTVEQIDHIAEQIDAISDAMRKIREGKLNERALLLLISDASGVSKTDVDKVLIGMEGLKYRFRRRNTKGEYV